MAIAEVPSAQRRLTELTLEFLGTLELERGLSRNTLEAYRSDLQQFGAFLAVRGQPGEGLDPLVVTPADLADFVSELAGGGDRRRARPATLQRKIACLRSFYRHLRREQIIDHDPTAELRAPRSSGRLPKVLSRDEVNRLLAQPSGDSVAALRDRALLETMYACGLRASEAIGLELAALDLQDGTLRAFGKGSKERLVPVGSSAVAALTAYLARGRPRLIGLRDESHVFLNMRGRPLSRQGLYKIVQGHAATRRAGRQDEPAHAASHVRDASAGRRLRPAVAAGDARPRRHRHDPDLHPPDRRPAARRLLRRAPACAAVAARAAADRTGIRHLASSIGQL